MAYGTQRFNAAQQGLSNNPYFDSNQANYTLIILISFRSILILCSHLLQDLPKGIFPAGLTVKILKSLLSFLHAGYMTCQS